MEKYLFDALQSLGSQWLTLVAVAVWLVCKSGSVRSFLGIRATERAQLSTDQQRFVENLKGMLADAKIERNQKIADLREECDAELQVMRETISTAVRGEARMRHLVGNLATYVAALQGALRKAGIEVPRFMGWDAFLADGGDPLLAFPIAEGTE